MGRRTAKVSRSICFDIELKLQSRLSGRIRESLDAAVVHVAATIEHDLLDAGRERTLGDRLSHDFSGGNIAATLDLRTRLLVERTGRSERTPAVIVDHLRVNMTERAIDAQARTLRRSHNALAHPLMNPLTMSVAR